MRQTWFHSLMKQSPDGYLHADVTDTYYAATAAIVGYGSQMMIGQGDGSPETFVAIPNVQTITPGDMTTGIVEKTHLRSLNRHKEKKATIRDSGPLACVAWWDPAHGAHKESGGDGFDPDYSLLSLWQDVRVANFKWVLPDEASNLEIIIVGQVTKYQVGQVTTEGIIPVNFDITPLQDYWSNP